MKIFTREEGGYHHCQIDNQSICSAYMWDWLEQVLQPARDCHSGPAEGRIPEFRCKFSACSGFRVRGLRPAPRNDI